MQPKNPWDMNQRHYKILVWLVIIMLILNISALGTILWFRFFTPPPAECTYLPRNRPDHFHLHDEFIRKEMGLDGNQLRQFSSLRDKHLQDIRTLATDIEAARKELFKEVQKENPDQAVLDSFSIRIGNLHTAWSRSSVAFMMEAKGVCNPDQQAKMFKMLERSRKQHLYKAGRMQQGRRCNPERMPPEQPHQ